MEETSHLDAVRAALVERFEKLDNKDELLKAPELKQLYAQIPQLPHEQRGAFGNAVNTLKKDLEELVRTHKDQQSRVETVRLDVTAPFDIAQSLPNFLPTDVGSLHPLTSEIRRIIDIFLRMGFTAEGSREIDDQYHMFESLNFPKGHPARDDWDTFMTNETDQNGDPFIAPAHTSTMQHRILSRYAAGLEHGEAIAAVVPDRVFRNEDLDARHEHTFYQLEGVYVDEGVTVGMLVATLQQFLEAYYGRKLKVRVNPFYFPFTEPSFEFALECPFCDSGCSVCSHSRWIELLGCGMIHPNVLSAAGIDAFRYSGFAFGCGIDRLVMMKHQIEDVRYLESGKLAFLRKFQEN